MEYRILIEREQAEELLDLPEGVSITGVEMTASGLVLVVGSDQDFGAPDLIAVYGPIIEGSDALHLAGFEIAEPA